MSGAATMPRRNGGTAARELTCVFTFLLGASASVAQQATVLDDFEAPSGWVSAPSDGVSLTVYSDSGHTGKAMRLDFDFQGHGGYAVARKAFRLELPENYAFTFWIRGDATVNNLEFKLVDSTGDNVWWRNHGHHRAQTRQSIRLQEGGSATGRSKVGPLTASHGDTELTEKNY